MATEIIPGRNGSVSIISDSYGHSINVGPPEPAEPARPAVARLNRSQVLRKFSWSAADFDEAQPYGFPAGALTTTSNWWRHGMVWKEDALDRWADAQREKADTILRLVGPSSKAGKR